MDLITAKSTSAIETIIRVIQIQPLAIKMGNLPFVNAVKQMDLSLDQKLVIILLAWKIFVTVIKIFVMKIRRLVKQIAQNPTNIHANALTTLFRTLKMNTDATIIATATKTIVT